MILKIIKVNNKLKIFELDKKELIEDKLNRITKAKIDTKNITYIETDFNNNWINDLLITNYNQKEKTFCSMLGISYYLDKETFKNTLDNLGKYKITEKKAPKGCIGD